MTSDENNLVVSAMFIKSFSLLLNLSSEFRATRILNADLINKKI